MGYGAEPHGEPWAVPFLGSYRGPLMQARFGLARPLHCWECSAFTPSPAKRYFSALAVLYCSR